MLLIGDQETDLQKALSDGDLTLPNDNEYESSSDENGSESSDSEDLKLPRAVMVAFREPHGVNLRIKTNKHKFTNGTNPIKSDKLNFMLSENIVPP